MNYIKMNVIKEIKEYKYAPRVQNKKKLDITYGADEKYLFACGISITSILLNNDNNSFSFHVFTDFLDFDNESKFKKLAENLCADVTLYLIDCKELKNLPRTERLNYSTYIRFIIADQLCESKDKILHLDADISCNASIEALNDIALGNNAGAVVKDSLGEIEGVKLSMRLGIPNIEQNYFNAGFLLLNLVYWRSHNITHQAFALLSSKKYKGKLCLNDQDALNILFLGKIINLSTKYNRIYNVSHERKRKSKRKQEDCVLPDLNDAALIHYTGSTKPWNSWANYTSCDIFKKAQAASEWKNHLSVPPQIREELKDCAKQYFYQKDYINWIKYRAKYYFRKYQYYFRKDLDKLSITSQG
ncbi:putative lipopolysaccharide 1,3-galactosyltransferase [Candidatus Regiella insecticola LSR1]|uniref:Putative lipopolysaccharide 1,3-galactosyltransferase n=1 Tax=Candidatus Regiella insecticola LSR1 TaxID=663321 RepID=E0WUS3_9ENTR|nr:glycosyltransferase [Candidatus Regiella insecticola]EFL91241.1 putative lipopolysaccharide 1,3-galactosyltransferase [Candidatus Regiella insecticola LSR1]